MVGSIRLDFDECVGCGNEVDDGVTVSDCPSGSGSNCDECFFCYCDGSC